MSTFADKLHELCRSEAVEAVNDPDACTAMTVELVQQLANAIAALTGGDKTATRDLTDKVMRCLPIMIFEKAKIVREADARMRAQS